MRIGRDFGRVPRCKSTDFSQRFSSGVEIFRCRAAATLSISGNSFSARSPVFADKNTTGA